MSNVIFNSLNHDTGDDFNYPELESATERLDESVAAALHEDYLSELLVRDNIKKTIRKFPTWAEFAECCLWDCKDGYTVIYCGDELIAYQNKRNPRTGLIESTYTIRGITSTWAEYIEGARPIEPPMYRVLYVWAFASNPIGSDVDGWYTDPEFTESDYRGAL